MLRIISIVSLQFYSTVQYLICNKEKKYVQCGQFGLLWRFIFPNFLVSRENRALGFVLCPVELLI